MSRPADAIVVFALTIAVLLVQRWRAGKSLRPTRAGVKRGAIIAGAIVLSLAGFVALFVLAAKILLR